MYFSWREGRALKIGHVEYIFEVKIKNKVKYYLQLNSFKIEKNKVKLERLNLFLIGMLLLLQS